MAKRIGASRPRKRQSRKEKLRSRREARLARRARPVRCPRPGCGSRQVKTHWFAPVDREHVDQMVCTKCGYFFSRADGWEAAGDFSEERRDRDHPRDEHDEAPAEEEGSPAQAPA